MSFLYISGLSGLGQGDSEYIAIGGIQQVIRSIVFEALGRAGFASQTHGPNNLLPCPLGTFVNPSVSDAKELKCVECPAGKLHAE